MDVKSHQGLPQKLTLCPGLWSLRCSYPRFIPVLLWSVSLEIFLSQGSSLEPLGSWRWLGLHVDSYEVRGCVDWKMRWAFQVDVVRVGVSPRRSSLLRHRMPRRAKHGRQEGRWTGDWQGMWLERRARGTAWAEHFLSQPQGCSGHQNWGPQSSFCRKSGFFLKGWRRVTEGDLPSL